MAEKCKNAYRKRGNAAVFCRAIAGDNDYCVTQYMCTNSQRWEASPIAPCKARHMPPVKDK